MSINVELKEVEGVEDEPYSQFDLDLKPLLDNDSLYE